jgi:hypothetical protein
VNKHYLPLVPLPTELSDQAAAELLQLLYDTARVIENYYAPQLQRYHRRVHPQPSDLNDDDSDPPF